MIKYDLMLEKQRLIGADKFSIAANANETICLYFHFDRSWRRFDSKAAVFRNCASKYYIIEIVADRAKVPWEVLTCEGEFELSVIGFEGEKVITSDKVEILVTESLLPEDCKTFSPSEVLFDRFKRECIAQAYLDYEDEINELKRAHTEEKLILGEKINEANERTQNAVDEKNGEIEELMRQHKIEKTSLNNTIRDLNIEIADYKEKAEKWDMVDRAMSYKLLSTQPLWMGGTTEFYLPMLNTSSISSFSSNNFSSKLKSIGLDLSSAKAFSAIFYSHGSIEKLELRNTHNVTSFSSLVENCKSIKTLKIDSLKSCSSLSCFAYNAVNLVTITFSSDVEASNYDKSFSNCRVLKEINGQFNMSYATNVNASFSNCTSLEKIRFTENSIGLSIDFSTCINLSKESMISIFNALYADAPATISISEHAFENNFTQSERQEWISFVTKTKGWVISIG